MRLKPEEKLQIAVVEYLRLCFPQCVGFAIPNEGNRGGLGQQIAVAKGLLPGIHDLCVLVPRQRDMPALPFQYWEPHFIELKTPNGRVSKAQVERHADFEAKGIKHAICRSVNEVARQMRLWGIPSQNKLDQAA